MPHSFKPTHPYNTIFETNPTHANISIHLPAIDADLGTFNAYPNSATAIDSDAYAHLESEIDLGLRDDLFNADLTSQPGLSLPANTPSDLTNDFTAFSGEHTIEPGAIFYNVDSALQLGSPFSVNARSRLINDSFTYSGAQTVEQGIVHSPLGRPLLPASTVGRNLTIDEMSTAKDTLR